MRLSERSTLAKIESNADVDDRGDDERGWPSLLLLLAGGGGGHVEVVSSFLRLGVLSMMLL